MSIYVNTNSRIISSDILVANKLAESASEIALNCFEWRYITLLAFNASVYLGIQTFLKTYKKSVIVGKGMFLLNNEDYNLRIRQFIVFGTDLNNIKHIFEWMRQQKLDNTGKYIVICRECDEDSAVRLFWDHRIINVVFIRSMHEAKDVGVFTYSMYDNDKCEISSPLKIQQDDFCNTSCSETIFPLKFKNLNLCQIIASTFIQKPYMAINKYGKPKGADGDLLLLIGQALNATLKVRTPQNGDGWGIQDADGNWLGSFGDIQNDFANFSMTSPAITMARFYNFHMSIQYNSINMVWVTRPALPKPAWEKLLRPFHLNVRVSLAITFLLVVALGMIARSNIWTKLGNRPSSTQPRRCIIFYSWTICMGMPTTWLPVKPFFLYMFMLWMLYCFMMRTFYQSSLIHAMKDNLLYPEFETLDDILKSDYSLGGVPTLKEYFVDDPGVYNNWKPIKSTEILPTMQNMSKGMKYVLAMNMATAKNFMRENHVKLHIVPQIIANCPTVIFYKKFSPITDAIDRVLGRLTEAGFSDKLYKNHATVIIAKEEYSEMPMNINHYMGCYVVLLTGWVLSTISFFLELYCKKIKKVLCLK